MLASAKSSAVLRWRIPDYLPCRSLASLGGWSLALSHSFGLEQRIFAPLWGSLSDRLGRKPILLIGVLGNVVGQLMAGWAGALWLLFLSRALAGILSSATLPTAMAYIGDSTADEERSSGLGKIGAAMGVGMIFGPGIGGWLAGRSLPLP